MMTKSLVLVVVATMIVGLTCCCGLPFTISNWDTVRGSGVVMEAVYTFEEPFSGVQLATTGDLYIEQGEGVELRVEGEENVVEGLEIEVRGDELWIGTRPGVHLRPTEPLNFYLRVPELDRVVLSGSGTVEVPHFETDSLLLELSGSGEIETPELEAEHLSVVLSGSGEVQASGFARSQKLTLTGSGAYVAEDLESRDVDIVVSGSGTAWVTAEERLDVEITGSGSVRYYGDPEVERQITGSGNVRRMDD